jgi:hypothetical protein
LFLPLLALAAPAFGQETPVASESTTGGREGAHSGELDLKLPPVGSPGAVAVRAAGAGSDLLIHTGYAPGVTAASALAREIRRGTLDRDEAEAAVARVLALRGRLS